MSVGIVIMETSYSVNLYHMGSGDLFGMASDLCTYQAKQPYIAIPTHVKRVVNMHNSYVMNSLLLTF